MCKCPEQMNEVDTVSWVQWGKALFSGEYCWLLQEGGVLGADTSLRGVFVLFGAASPKVHPAQVVSVLYPVSRGRTTGSAAQGGPGLVRCCFSWEQSGQQLFEGVARLCVVLRRLWAHGADLPCVTVLRGRGLWHLRLHLCFLWRGLWRQTQGTAEESSQ